jgi:cation diffusion facilitator family transporter
MNPKEIVGLLAVLANLILAIGKILTGIISGAASIIADGINSATDIVSSIIGFIGIKIAQKPADKEHPYGHGKAEVIAGFVITLIIIVSALWIIYDAIKGFFLPQELSLNYLAFIVMGGSALINLVMSQIKIYYGKKHQSYSLISDGLHTRIDLFVSAGIFISLFFIKYYSKIDSIIALIVGLYILKESLELGKETTDSLIGVSAGEEIENKIKEIAKKENIEIQELKTQKRGSEITANLKINLPDKLKLDKATEISEKLRKKLIQEINNLKYVAIQIQSHNIETGYHKPTFGLGRGYGWQKRGRFQEAKQKELSEKTKGAGPGGYCICPKCKNKEQHKRGVPCSTLKCPKCGAKMKREDKNE